MMSLDEILYNYKACSTLRYYNLLQRELILESSETPIEWIGHYAAAYREYITKCETVEELRAYLYVFKKALD